MIKSTTTPVEFITKFYRTYGLIIAVHDILCFAVYTQQRFTNDILAFIRRPEFRNVATKLYLTS